MIIDLRSQLLFPLFTPHTSCSNPILGGLVIVSKGGGGDWDNTFPNDGLQGLAQKA